MGDETYYSNLKPKKPSLRLMRSNERLLLGEFEHALDQLQGTVGLLPDQLWDHLFAELELFTAQVGAGSIVLLQGADSARAREAI